MPTAFCSRSNSCQAFPSPVPAARSSGPAGVVRRRRRLGKRPPPGPSWPQPPALCQLTHTRVGLFQAEPIRLQRSEFVQSSIDALKALLQHGCGADPRSVPIDPSRPRPTSEHQPPAERDRTLRRPLVAASALDGSRLDPRKIPGAQRLGRLNTPARGRLRRPPEYPRPERPIPTCAGVANVEELLLAVQLKLVQCLRPRLPPEAINFLTVHANATSSSCEEIDNVLDALSAVLQL